MNEKANEKPNKSASGAQKGVPEDSAPSAKWNPPSAGAAQESPEGAKQTQAPMTSQTYFKDMQQFLKNCRHDERLTPLTQLIYRTMIALANQYYWSYPFEVSDHELKKITHITGSREVTAAKQRLKSLGYIDFHGKPSKVTIFALTDTRDVQEAVQEAVQNGPPTPPSKNTRKQANKTKGERKNKKKEGESDDVQHSGAHLKNPTEASDSALLADLERRLAKLY